MNEPPFKLKTFKLGCEGKFGLRVPTWKKGWIHKPQAETILPIPHWKVFHLISEKDHPRMGVAFFWSPPRVQNSRKAKTCPEVQSFYRNMQADGAEDCLDRCGHKFPPNVTSSKLNVSNLSPGTGGWDPFFCVKCDPWQGEQHITFCWQLHLLICSQAVKLCPQVWGITLNWHHFCLDIKKYVPWCDEPGESGPRSIQGKCHARTSIWEIGPSLLKKWANEEHIFNCELYSPLNSFSSREVCG